MDELPQDEMTIWPEEAWERRRPYVDLGQAQLAELVDRLIGRADVVQSALLKAGKCNTNVRAELSDGKRVVVRVYENEADAFEKDRTLVDVLDDSVPVPRLLGALRAPEETFQGHLGEKLAGRPVAVFEWIEGQKPFEVLETRGAEAFRRVVFELGATLAAIGPQRTFEAHGLLDGDLNFRRRFASNRASFLDFIDWSLTEGRAGERLGAGLAERLAEFAQERAHLLDVTEGDYRLVHGNYKLSNLLVRADGEEWEVAAVLDWEYAFAGAPLFDAAILLRHADRWPPGSEEAFARGFRERGGELPQRWREMTRMFDLMNLCGFLNASGEREVTFSAVRRLIEETVVSS